MLNKKRFRNKVISVITALIVCVMQISFLFNIPVSASAPASSYSLLFEDHFSGTSLNTNNWVCRTGDVFGGINRQENVWVGSDSDSNTNLHMDFKYEDFNNDGTAEYTGGGVISRKNFGYGYYEVRAKLYGASKGLHQSFWTMGTSNSVDVNSGLAPANNQVLEIDGFEVDSATPNTIGTNSHYYIPSHVSNGSANHSIDTTNWFVMGYEWLPGRINFYINNSLVRTITLSQYYAPQNVWLTALATVTGFGGAVPPNAGAQMQVDYFRFYGKKTEGNLIGNNGFEYSYSTPNDQNPIGWIETGDNTESSYINTDYYDGGYSLKHSSAASYNVTTKQILNYIPNSNYKLTAWVKSSGGQTEATMKATGYGGTDLSVNIPELGTWTQITIDNINVTNNNAVISFVSNAAASQWILVDKVEFIDKSEFLPETIVLDNGDSGYTEYGTWYNSGLLGYLGSSTRYGATVLGNYAKWTPTIKKAGEYDVYIYKVVNASNSDPNAIIEVADMNGYTTTYLDYTTGSSGWVYLGKYNFNAGTAGYIKNTLNTSLKYPRADSVKLVPRQIFVDKFEAGYANFTTSNGSWSISEWNGSNTLDQSSASSEGYAYAGDISWNNYDFEATIVPTYNTGFIGLLGRYQDSNNFYHFRFNKTGNTVDLVKKVNGSWTTLGSQSFTATTNTAYVMKMEFDGSSIKCYVDGFLKFNVTDSSLSSGRIGFRAYNTSGKFDNISVLSNNQLS